MADTEKQRIGKIGENLACVFLEKRGYEIKERNYRKKWGEIDIVAKKADTLHFVEVKTVVDKINNVELSRFAGATDQFRPEENVHPWKLKRLSRAIQTYLLDHKVPESREWQVDIACVYLDFSTRKAHVEILENVIL